MNILIEQISDPHNVKEKLLIICKKLKHKIGKTIRNNYLSAKTFENPNIDDIKSVITEHPKTSQKLSNTIRQAGKVSSDSSFYSDTNKVKKFQTKKM